MVTVDELNIPPDFSGSVMVGEMWRTYSGAGGFRGGRTFQGKVADGTPTPNGRIRITVDGTGAHAKVNNAVKAIQTGDLVRVVRRGGIWHIVAVESYRPPPLAPEPPTTNPPAASTVSGSNLTQMGSVPTPPYSSVGTTLEWVVQWANNTRAHLISLELWNMNLRSRFNAMVTQVNSTRTVTNTNASRLNSTRDLTTGVRNTVRNQNDALRNDRIVR